MAARNPHRRRTPRPHLLASFDPGPGRGQHRRAVRHRGQRRRLVPAAADPRRPASTTGSRWCVAEAARGDRRGQGPARRRSSAPTTTRPRQLEQLDRARSSLRGAVARLLAWCSPARSATARQPRTPGATRSSRARRSARVPDRLVSHFDDSPSSAWTSPRIRGRTGLRHQGRARHRVGSQIRLPADGGSYTLYYLFPLGRSSETIALVTRALLTAGDPAAGPGRRA